MGQMVILTGKMVILEGQIVIHAGKWLSKKDVHPHVMDYPL